MLSAPTLPQAYTFIITYGRSGSTLLQNLLNNIPGYQIRGENNNALYFIARSWNAVRRSEQMRALRNNKTETGPTHPWYGAEVVYPPQYGKALAEVFSRTVLKPAPGTRVSGFKEIRFHTEPGYFWIYMAFMYENFPQARFVINTRDHASVAKSGWWADMDQSAVFDTLRRAENLFDNYQNHFPDRCCRMHYDDYVADPEKLRVMFDFLGEPWDPNMVDRVMNTRLSHLHSRV